MVDHINNVKSQPTPPTEKEGNKLKTFMGKTPNFLKTKFLSVIDSSNDLINDISNRFDLSLSTSSDTETDGNNDYDNNNLSSKKDDDSIDESIIDFESRKVKERRAIEEVLSGKYRQPNFVSRLPKDEYNMIDLNHQTSTSLSSSNYSNNSLESHSANNEQECADVENCNSNDVAGAGGGGGGCTGGNNSCGDMMTIADDGVAITNTKIKNGVRIIEQPIGKENNLDVRPISKLGNLSSATTSEDVHIPSVESSDLKIWIRSESENSVPSWASSISLDSHTEELTVEFMKKFIEILFRDCSTITLELKHEFGQIARTETGRLWFSRLISAHRIKTKRVNETTFYSLIQYFAIVLFECAESDDFSPAKILMNMCFTFYHEVDVPGCEPYREYLYIYLREQQIWHTLRFWNAAFFDALQCERVNRPVPHTNKLHKKKLRNKNTSIDNSSNNLNDSVNERKHIDDDDDVVDGDNDNEDIDDDDDDDSGEEQTIHQLDRSDSKCIKNKSNNPKKNIFDRTEIIEDQEFQRNISFGQLGTFTCNMHAFGLSRELCTEFLRKQCIIANLNKEQEKMLRDNINRMYKETAKWRDQ